MDPNFVITKAMLRALLALICAYWQQYDDEQLAGLYRHMWDLVLWLDTAKED